MTIIENFVSPTEEETFLKLVDWKENTDGDGSMKHRKVQHFGYEFRYDTNNVDVDKPLTEKPMPKECDLMWKKLATMQHNFSETDPQQLTVNRYEPGQGSDCFQQMKRI